MNLPLASNEEVECICCEHGFMAPMSSFKFEMGSSSLLLAATDHYQCNFKIVCVHILTLI